MLKEKIKRNNSTGIETIDDNKKTINEENSFVFKNDVVNDEIKPTIENFSKFDFEKNKLKVSVLVFGKPTPIELSLTQVEKG